MFPYMYVHHMHNWCWKKPEGSGLLELGYKLPGQQQQSNLHPLEGSKYSTDEPKFQSNLIILAQLILSRTEGDNLT